jgi:branched-chain amino acid transport system substrate-binding protein
MRVEKRRKILMYITLVLCAFFTLSCSGDNDDAPTGPSGEIAALRIGAMFDFDESGPVHGQSMLAALETAEADINSYYEENGADSEIEFVVQNTEDSIDTLLNAFKILIDDGITVIVTPLTSADLNFIRMSAEDLGIIFISQTSTSPALSVDDDLIRLIPDDTAQASILATAMASDGVKTLFTLYRNDLWGYQLAEALGLSFTAAGGTVEPSIYYNADIPVMDIETSIAQLAESVEKTLETKDVGDIAIHISCFEEGVTFLKEASKYPVLSTVKWYSADGFARNAELLDDSDAVQFAVTTGLSASQFGEPVSTDYTTIQAKVAEKTGITPFSLAMLVYDTAWIAAKAAIGSDMKDSIAYKAKVIEVAESHEGLFGKAVMNDVGDRTNGSYDIWTVTAGNDTYFWVKSATYHVAE